jgi:hypothetical protein
MSGTPPAVSPSSGQLAPIGSPMGGAPMGQQQQGLPHDIRGLVPYETPWYMYAAYVGAGVLLALAIYLLYKWWQRKQANKVIPEVVVDHWAEVKKKIKHSHPQEPFEKPQQIEFFYQMSLLLRECIELRTKIRATDLTYQELKDPIDRKLPLKSNEKTDILLFLERADMIKFAEKKTTLDEAREYKKQIGLWASMLTPRAEIGGR